MSATPELPRSPRIRRADSAQPLRRKDLSTPAPRRPLWRRWLGYILIFATIVLVVDALVGERGLVATTRARQRSAELQNRVSRLRSENAQLRESADRLRTDPTAVESLARETLGLIRQGEVLVVVKDVKPTSQ